MPFKAALLYSLIGFALGFIFQMCISTYFVESHDNKFWTDVVTGLGGYIISVIILNNFAIQAEILKLNNKIQVSENSYQKVQHFIVGLSEVEKQFYRIKLENINAILINMLDGDILLTREEMLDFWEKGFDSTARGEFVHATNFVSEKDWNYWNDGDKDGYADQIQILALKKGVKIQRIMMIGKNHENEAEVIKLAQQQEKLKIQVKKIMTSKFDDPQIRNKLFIIGNSLDFVVFGEKYLLLTFVDEGYKIKNAIWSINNQKIKLAMEIYQWLWSNAENI